MRDGCFAPPMGGISTLMSMVRTTLSEKEILMRFRKGGEGASFTRCGLPQKHFQRFLWFWNYTKERRSGHSARLGKRGCFLTANCYEELRD
jgi:hypothetical protein